MADRSAGEASADLSQNASTSATRGVSSFFLSQNTRSRRGPRNSGASSLAQREDDGDDSLASRAGQHQRSQRNLADLSALTNESDEEEDGQGDQNFSREAAYANRLDASAAHIGHLLRKGTGSGKGKGKSRRLDDDAEYQHGEGDEEEEDEDEMSDPNGHKRKHGQRSNQNGSAASSSRNAPVAPSTREVEEVVPVRNRATYARAQNDRALPEQDQPGWRFAPRFASSALSVIRNNSVHILLGLALITYLQLYRGGKGSTPGLSLSPDAHSSLLRTTSKLSQRLSHVESQMAKFGKVQGAHSKTLTSLTDRLSSLELSAQETEEHVRRWKAELKGERSKEEAQLKRWKEEVEQALKDERGLLEQEIAKLEAVLKRRQQAADAVSTSTSSKSPSDEEWKEAQNHFSKHDAELLRLKHRLQTVETDISTTQAELSALDKRSQVAQARTQEALKLILDDPTSWLAGYLPSLVPVRWESSAVQKAKGKGARERELRIDEAFWIDLRGHFASRKELAEVKDAKPSAVSEPIPKAADIIRQMSKEAKYAASQEAQRVLDNSITDGVLLDRSAFLVLLEKEIQTASTALEQKLHVVQQGITREKRDREGAIDELRSSQRDLAEGVSSTDPKRVASKDGSRWGLSWGSSGNEGGPEAEKRGDAAHEQDPTSRVIELIDQALETYSLDRLGRPDFALWSAGARVLPALTSPTFGQGHAATSVKSTNFWNWPWGGRKDASTQAEARQPAAALGRGRPPVTALHPDTSPGMCWAFAGTRGTLGFELARSSVRVTHVTIEHAPERLLAGNGAGSALGSAPRLLHVWGRVVGGPVEQTRVQAFIARQGVSHSRSELRSSGSSAAEKDDDFQPDGAKAGQWIRLGRFEYGTAPSSTATARMGGSRKSSPAGHPHIQTFEVDPAVVALDVAVDAVQVVVLSNHGNKAYTCLYRVRIHGNSDGDASGSDDETNPRGWV
ncbi:hypothetical protein OC835_002036 [Tilletia horrida]|nr:hypothetical protein OC835_002036 [Tilletia horrida]